VTPALPTAPFPAKFPRLLDTGRPRLLLVAFCLLLWLPGFFLVPPSDRDESRFAQATKQMLETGDFVAIRNGAEARNRKPIGIYWLQAPGAALARAAGLATSNPVWPYRIPSLLGGLVAVLATWSMGRRLIGPRAAMLAGMMLAASVLLTVETAFAKTDAALLGATTLAMGVLARAWLGEKLGRGSTALFWLACGVGILLKGPITPMVAALTILALVDTDRRAKWLGRWLSVLRPAWGAPLMLLVVLPWFVAIGVATHGQFFRDAIGGDLAGKLAGGDDAHGAPPGYHLLLLSITFFPAAPAVLAALPAAWRARREAAVRFLLAWIVPSWIVFEGIPTKLPHYPLPLFPALALLAAGFLCGTLGGSVARPTPKWIGRTALGLFVVAAVACGVGGAAIPILLEPQTWPFDLLGIPALIAACLVLACGIGRDRPRAVMASLLAMPLLIWSLLGLELPNATPLWIAPRVQAALAAHGARSGFASVGYAEPSLMFVVGTDTQMLAGGAAGAQFLAGAPGRVVLVDSRDLPGFLAAARARGIAPHSFAELSGFNYSNGRRVALTLFSD
jgi:4-amino-4-deoxy-L-arabinose transferase-like glycosyltransferase